MQLRTLSIFCLGLLVSITLSGSMMAMDSDEDSTDNSPALPTSVQLDHSSDEEESNESGSEKESEGPILTFQNPQSQWLVNAVNQARQRNLHLELFLSLRRAMQTSKMHENLYVVPSTRRVNILYEQYLTCQLGRELAIDQMRGLSRLYRAAQKSIDLVNKTGQQMIQKLDQIVSRRLQMEDEMEYRIVQVKQELEEGEQTLLLVCWEADRRKWLELKEDEAKAARINAEEENKQLVARQIAQDAQAWEDIKREKKMARPQAELDRIEKQKVQDKIASDRFGQKLKMMKEEAAARVAEEERQSRELNAQRIAQDKKMYEEIIGVRFRGSTTSGQ